MRLLYAKRKVKLAMPGGSGLRPRIALAIEGVK